MTNTKVESVLQTIRDHVARLQAMENFVLKHSDFLESYNFDTLCQKVDFNQATRLEIIAIMYYFTGKWSKEYLGTQLNYIQVIDGVTVRIYDAELPPSCKIVDEIIDIEAVTIPARTEVRKKIVCNEGNDE